MKKVFIDGAQGTTGLRIRDRLSEREDIEIIELDESSRKDRAARKLAMQKADAVLLCLPDKAAETALSLFEGSPGVLIDCSSAHRCDPAFTYGFPELRGQRAKIQKSKKLSNPGCHATAFISLIRPLTEAGIISEDTRIPAFSLTGYSGGGKKMIAEYETAAKSKESLFEAPREYSLEKYHKHIPEMMKYGGLKIPPNFTPIVANFYSGLLLSVPLYMSDLNGNISDIADCYRSYYSGEKLVTVIEGSPEDQSGLFSAASLCGTDAMLISVNKRAAEKNQDFEREPQIILSSAIDNLGKGASGQAIQNLNIMLGFSEISGLKISGTRRRKV